MSGNGANQFGPARSVEERMQSCAERFWEKVEKGPGCWEWRAYRTPQGYGVAWNGVRKLHAQRMSLELTLGRELGPTEMALHRCDNPSCVRPSHLYVGDAGDNMRDMHSRGRHPARTEAHRRLMSRVSSARRLTDEQVIEARRLRAEGQGYRALADLFGVSYHTIALLCARKTHRYV